MLSALAAPLPVLRDVTCVHSAYDLDYGYVGGVAM
jgi:hypothetical protein